MFKFVIKPLRLLFSKTMVALYQIVQAFDNESQGFIEMPVFFGKTTLQNPMVWYGKLK